VQAGVRDDVERAFVIVFLIFADRRKNFGKRGGGPSFHPHGWCWVCHRGITFCCYIITPSPEEGIEEEKQQQMGACSSKERERIKRTKKSHSPSPNLAYRQGRRVKIRAGHGRNNGMLAGTFHFREGALERRNGRQAVTDKGRGKRFSTLFTFVDLANNNIVVIEDGEGKKRRVNGSMRILSP